MLLEHHYLDCLSQGSYIVADSVSRQAVVIDPRRDIGCYLDSAREHGLTIVGIIMTHFHADFVAGHLELAAATGAWIGLGSRARDEVDYPVRYLEHGELVCLGAAVGPPTQAGSATGGELVLEILHTPGHTWESISILARENGTPRALFSGDTLFVGDVGRPDLAAAVGAVPAELARAQYRSLRDIILALPDDVTVHPSHGAGSACGKALGSEKSSTIGKERRTNPALAPMTEDEFASWLMLDQPPAPSSWSPSPAAKTRPPCGSAASDSTTSEAH
ncbi:Glyoxylase, beta-lactamase superfamily II [Micrococcales bacterium KH10]|nr:Glyoxylase, beta-lactamase superfamily II [Micrococcales bacterium KH10]